jgi:hypothetical protein
MTEKKRLRNLMNIVKLNFTNLMLSMRANNFIAVYSKNYQNIIQTLHSMRAIQIEQNRKRLPIIQTSIYCVRQEIALRGIIDYRPLSLDNSKPIYSGDF